MPKNCKHCDNPRFEARGAIWCPRCDHTSAELMAQRSDVKKG